MTRIDPTKGPPAQDQPRRPDLKNVGSRVGSSSSDDISHKIAGKADFSSCKTGQDFLKVLKDKIPKVKTKSELENVLTAAKSFLESQPNVDEVLGQINDILDYVDDYVEDDEDLQDLKDSFDISYGNNISGFLHDVTFEGSSVDDPPCPDIEYGFMLPAPSSEKPSINDSEHGLLSSLGDLDNISLKIFSAAVRSQLANYPMVTVRDVVRIFESDSFAGIQDISKKNILIRDLTKVMVPEIGLGTDVSAFDDFLDLIKKDPLKGCFKNSKLSRMTRDAFHYQAQVIGDARGSGLFSQDIPRFHGVCLQHFADACEAQSKDGDDKFASVAVAARRSVTTQQQVSLMDKTESKDEWQGVLDSHFSDADHLFLTEVGEKGHNVALTINKREDGQFSLIVINLGYGSEHGQVNSYTVPDLNHLAGTLKSISGKSNIEDEGMNNFYRNLEETYRPAIPLPCPFHEQYSGDCGSRNPQVAMVYAFSDIANKTVLDPDGKSVLDPAGPYQATIEAIKFDAKITAENMKVDSAGKRHMLSAAVTHYDNVTTRLLDLSRMVGNRDSFDVEQYREDVRALCVKIAMDPQNISVDLRGLKDICSDLEPSNSDLKEGGYRGSLGKILQSVERYDLSSNTTANNTNLKSVQQQLFELAEPSDVPQSKSLEDLLAEKTDHYRFACSFFESCGVQPEIRKAIEDNAWMADHIFERLEQHISDFGLDNFIYEEGNIDNLRDVTTAFANSLSALLPDGFDVDLKEAEAVTPAKPQSATMKSALERASRIFDEMEFLADTNRQIDEFKKEVMEHMAKWSETISSDEMDGYYEYLNQMSEDEVSDFIYESLITTYDNGDMVLERTFDKAIRLFQLKKERQLALKKFPKPSSIMDQKKKHAFIQKRKAFFKGATLKDYKTFNGLDDPEKQIVLKRFSDFRLRKSPNTFNQIMSGTNNSLNQRPPGSRRRKP